MFHWRISWQLPSFGRGGGGKLGLGLRWWWCKACGDIPFWPTGFLFTSPDIFSLLRPTWLHLTPFCCAGSVVTAYKLDCAECDMSFNCCNSCGSIMRSLARLFTMLRDSPLPVKTWQPLFSIKRISTHMKLFHCIILCLFLISLRRSQFLLKYKDERLSDTYCLL